MPSGPLHIRRWAVLVAFFVVSTLGASTASAAPFVPDEFLAKLYTEALGRIPDQAGWQSRVNSFTSKYCSPTPMRTHAVSVYTSSEYNGLGYDNESRLLTLFRGVLHREPDPTTFNSYLAQLNTGTAWTTVVNSMVNSSEFSSLANGICTSGNPSTYWGTQPVMNLTVTGSGFAGGTGAQLQALLNATPSGGTVWLAPKSVTRISTTLIIPKGVTLATTGLPARARYASMGRLVRTVGFEPEAVRVLAGAKLRNVWVDGGRNRPENYVNQATNVVIHGGPGSVVENSRLSNSRGWSTLQALGWDYPCSSTTVRNNLVTAYSSEHTNGRWTDGLSISCENALVENNEIVDATDVSIVLFRATDGRGPQTSTIRNNAFLNAGKSSYGGLVVDPLFDTGVYYSFVGASITNNLMWTGSKVHWDIGISVGTRPWFPTHDMGHGVSVTNNTTGIIPSRADLGIGVSGMLNVYVQGNTLQITHVNAGNCPDLDVVAAVSTGHASGSIQSYVNQPLPTCIGH